MLRVAWDAPRRAALHGSRPALQPALHLFWFEQLILMSWCCVSVCITYLLQIVRSLTFLLLYRVNLARRAGGAVRAVWRLPHWKPDFLVPLRFTCRAATSRLKGWEKKHCSVMSFATPFWDLLCVMDANKVLCLGVCLSSGCEKQWHYRTLLCEVNMLKDWDDTN